MKKKQVNIWLQFNNGLCKFLKVIELRDKSLKLAEIDAPHEWTIHQEQAHMKKLKSNEWIQSESERPNKYMYIEKTKFINFNGIGWLYLIDCMNGLNLSKDIPKKEDKILRIDKKSDEGIIIIIGHCRTLQTTIDNNIKNNNIYPYVITNFDLQDIIVGIKNE